MDESLVDDLQQLGLNIYEAKVYLALMERDSLDTGEVAKISRVPRARTYDVLDSLLNKGLASLRPGKLKKYSALEIETFKRKLVSDTKKEYVEKEKKIERVSLTLRRKLESIYATENLTSDPIEYIEIIKEPSQVANKFARLVKEAKEEVLVFTKPPFAAAPESKELNGQVSGEVASLRRGVVHKSIYEIPVDPTERLLIYKEADEMVKAGEEARAIDKLPTKLAIFDEKIVIFTLEDPLLKKPSVTTQIIEHRSLAKTLKIVFNTLWEKAMDYHILKV